MVFVLPKLPYAYDALEPYMSKETIEYHYGKHHQAYVDNENKIIEADKELEKFSLEELVKKSFGSNPSLFNNVAQDYNHRLFWKCMKKDGGGKKIPQKLAQAIESDLGGYEKFRSDFIHAGMTQFGSGWSWLSMKEGQLMISKTQNGENPLVYGSSMIILGVDVWEHSYYIDYRNLRMKYLEVFFDYLINWDYLAENYEISLNNI